MRQPPGSVLHRMHQPNSTMRSKESSRPLRFPCRSCSLGWALEGVSSVLDSQAVLQEVSDDPGGLPAAVLVFRWLSGEMSQCISMIVFVISSDLSFLKYNNIGVEWLLRVWTNDSAPGEGCSSCAWVSGQAKRETW
jgi:hypothetical protein